MDWARILAFVTGMVDQGTDFLTTEVLTLRGLVTYYVLFFIRLESRRVDIAGITVHPDERWMRQIPRNVTMEGCGALRDCRYLLHDRDTKYTQSFRAIIASGRVEALVLPARSPNLNAYAERWVRSVKEECLSKVILFGERSLRRALSEYVEHFHAEAESSGEGQRPAVPSGYEDPSRRVCSMPRATGRTFALLPSGGSVNGGRRVSEASLSNPPGQSSLMLIYDRNDRDSRRMKPAAKHACANWHQSSFSRCRIRARGLRFAETLMYRSLFGTTVSPSMR